MPRVKSLSDEDVAAVASEILHRHGPEGLTFQSLSKACGLSAATLVQRFSSKARLKQAALLHAWDGLDRRTEELAARVPRTPEGAIALLVGLSGGYGDIETYAEGLLLLREDLKDPVLRARGAQWRAALVVALDACFAGTPGLPRDAGLLAATHWQGALLWWSFDPQEPVDIHVGRSLAHFIDQLTARD